MKQFLVVKLTDATHDSLREGAFPSERIAHDVHGISYLYDIAVTDPQHGSSGSCDLEHYEVAFAIGRYNSLKVVLGRLAHEIGVSARCALHDMEICDYFAVVDKEAASIAQRLTTFVLDGHKHGRSESRSGDFLGCLGIAENRSEK